MELIYANDNCTGCNKCVRDCPVLIANVATDAGKVTVDSEKCIACGACFDACEHNAREYQDDTKSFFTALEAGKKISVILAPAFLANYPHEYKKVLGYLKKKGVNHIYSVSFGADITTWGYLKYITEHQFLGGISQPCPAVVNYVEKYIPELLPKMMPIHSPMMCMAIYIKKYLKCDDELAFISPCIAKKTEITDPNCYGYVKYNVTFKKLFETIGNKYQGCKEYEDELEYGMGALYPMPGGLRENVEHFLGKEQVVRQVEGEKEAYRYLHEYLERIKKNKRQPFMVDILNCSKGCIYGTATELERNTDDVMLTLSDMRNKTANAGADAKRGLFGKKTKNGSPWDESVPEKDRLVNLMKAFEDLDINDFVRKYTNKSVEIKEPAEHEMQEIFASMNKTDAASQKMNCESCGYSSCRNMARAIYNGVNVKENCVHYVKSVAENEKEKIQIAILDIEMPGINGIQAAERIREKDKKCCIIFLTAFDEFAYAKKAITVRALDYLLKPWDEKELMLVLEEAMRMAGEEKDFQKEKTEEVSEEEKRDDPEELAEDDAGENLRMNKVTEIIRDYIRENYMYDLSVQDLADKMNYSEPYFCRLFKQSFGQNFTAYLTEYRVSMAKKMLEEPTVNIKDIGKSVGYEDSNYFTKVFRRITGQSPSEYRNTVFREK